MALFTQITLCIAGKTVDIVLCICFIKSTTSTDSLSYILKQHLDQLGFCYDLIHADYSVYYRNSRSNLSE